MRTLLRMALLPASLILLQSTIATAETYEQNFDDFPDGTTELGDGTVLIGQAASVQGGRLQLTIDNQGLGFSSFTIPALRDSSRGWTATWDYELFDSVGGNPPADGFSFNYGDFQLGETGAAEEGWGNGVNGGSPSQVQTNLSFEVDTWQNFDAEQGVNLSGLINGQDAGNLAFTNGPILNDGAGVQGSMTASYNAENGTVSFSTTGLDTNADFVDLLLPAGLAGNDDFNFGFSARVGGANQDLFIDNLVIIAGTFDETDTDGDGIPDGFEELYFPGDLTQLGSGDFDGDGVNDPEEYIDETDPTAPDSDNDGSDDGQEKAAGTDPNNEDSDNDGLLDGVETNTGTFSGATDTGTDPLMIDTDGDSAADGFEVTEGTDPNDPDSTPGFPTIQPSFIPINEAAPGAYAPDLTQSGVNYQENHYGGGVILNGEPEANYNAHTSGSPAPLRSFDAIEPVTSHGVGGTAISFLDRPWLDGGGENFSVRYNGYLDMTGFVPGNYTIHLGADDTNYFIMDTADGQVTGQHSCCPQNQATAFTMTTPGIFPFDNVFGEQGGGDWTDIGISGPGIIGIVAIGDTAAGSPPVYPIGVNAADTDGDGLPDFWETSWPTIDNLTQLSADGDLDNDGSSDLEEYTAETDPTDDDSDDDGLSDGAEATAGTDPTDTDSDGDGLLDGVETGTGTFVNASDTGTDPLDNDSDGDLFFDGQEVDRGFDPNDAASNPEVNLSNHLPERVLYRRTDNLPAADFTGALPENVDQSIPFGVLDDPSSLILEGIDVDREPGGLGTDLTGDNHDIVYVFQFYDADGIFSFTENYDDRVKVVATPIAGATNLNATGPSSEHTDTAWDVRTFANFNFDEGGWFNVDIWLTEDGGGAQSAADIGFGYYNDTSFNVGDFGGIGYTSTFGISSGLPAEFDTDPFGLSWGAYIDTFDPDEDSDGDSIPDGYEIQFFPGDLTQLGPGDFDSDGVADPQEYLDGTDPTDPDADNDGSNDGEEKAAGTDPANPDSDSDGLLDGVESGTGIFVSATDTGTDPLDNDTDGDNAADGFEVESNTDPNDANSTPGIQIIQPSFVPINELGPGAYGPDFTQTGLNYQENKYGGGTILNGQSQANYNIHVSGNPAPTRSVDAIVPWASHGDGGNFSIRNSPFVDGGGDNFTVRYNGYLDMSTYSPGQYTIHIVSDDTNYFIIDTADGTVIADDPDCCAERTQSFTISTPGIFPFDNVFGEQGGGEWTDVAISGPGIPGIVALGDTDNGSPPVYPIAANSEDSDGDDLPDAWETSWTSIDDLSQLSGAGDFDNDGSTDGEELTARTDPTNPDTDDDGLPDGVETGTGTFVDTTDTGTNALNADTDADGLSDGVETNSGTFIDVTDTGTNPLSVDSDGDLCPDGVELARGSDPNEASGLGAGSGAYLQNFDGFPNGTTDLCDGSAIGSNNGPASIQDGQLRLTESGLGSTHASFRTPALGGSAASWTMTFDYTVTAGGDPADGFSVSYGAIPPLTNPTGTNTNAANGSGEEGWGTDIPWVSVEFDTYDNGAGEGGLNVATNNTAHPDLFFLQGRPVPNGGSLSGTATISWDGDAGTLSAYLTGLANPIEIVDLEIPNFTADDSYIWAFSARTGGATETVLIDNLSITTTSPDIHNFSVSSEDGGDTLDFEWNSYASEVYTVVSSTDPEGDGLPETWTPVPGLENLTATVPLNTHSIPSPGDPLRIFHLLAGPVPALFEDDFESGAEGWTTLVNDPSGNTAWELGSPVGSTGPLEGADGSLNAWSTNLGDYGTDSDISLRSPSIDLSAIPGAELSFKAFRDADGFADIASVRFLRAADQVQLGAAVDLDMTIFDTDWSTIEVPVDPAALGEVILIEFNFASDSSPDAFSGLSIDDVSVSAN